MVSLETKGVAAFVHIHGAKAEAKDIKFTCLSWALSVAFAINELLIFATLGFIGSARLNAGTIVINVLIWADRSANITLCDNERRRALRVPLPLALLAIMAFLVLSVASPQR